ncbi:hypothetical protein EVAR_26773_1 [Eumeta japonica]|uniref:Uncharacterized protein n=1 Tax=Eumeta variegata TaxID=151549 RepID=A0A4C1XFA2_EUMVA|nr:hypothetical protein EVAR_26773_1 [Eumeta japonica]
MLKNATFLHKADKSSWPDVRGSRLFETLSVPCGVGARVDVEVLQAKASAHGSVRMDLEDTPSFLVSTGNAVNLDLDTSPTLNSDPGPAFDSNSGN